jgi:hypothetical protein
MTTINAAISGNETQDDPDEEPVSWDQKYFGLGWFLFNGDGSIDSKGTFIIGLLFSVALLIGLSYGSVIHQDRMITVTSKEIVSDNMYVVGTDHVLYKVMSVLDYTDMNVGNMYKVNSAYNGFFNSIDMGLSGKPSPVHIDSIITKY